MIFFYSVLHLLVDGVCALAMFGSFLGQEDGHFYILVYNFCAFALQMPFGVILDSLQERAGDRRPDFACLMAVGGVLCTLAGAAAHPAVLGIGNALFHVGGGVGTIREDRAGSLRGRGLGVFVAPGALGLFLGAQIAGEGVWQVWTEGIGILMALLCIVVCRYRCCSRTARAEVPEMDKGAVPGRRRPASAEVEMPGRAAGGMKAAFCCLAVVALRSYIGMAVALPWKSGLLAGTLAVLAVVCGKVAGGFAAARHGMRKTAVVSLGLAAACYLGSAVMPLGLAAVFLFNMTMPVTLYWLVCRLPKRPGFAFGFLTFALFLGFLPVYFGLEMGAGNMLGCAGSVLSLLLLAAGMGRGRMI